MGRSHAKRRNREAAIRWHRPRVTRELERVCTELGLRLPPGRRRGLIDEVMWLASPFAFRGLDAVIPAGRTDLMRAWFFHRLTGAIETPADVQRMARLFAPSPDNDFCPGLRCVGDPTSAEVAAAYASRHRRWTHKEEVPATSNPL